jgi:hypothetical protein
MNTIQRQQNERHFLTAIQMTDDYIWKNKGNVYSITSANKMKPKTLKGYVELSEIVRREFMDLFVELPDNTEGMTKEMIWNVINQIS